MALINLLIRHLPHPDWGGPGTITGTVKQKGVPSNIPLYRRVRLYDERSGQCAGETWSDPVTGVYTFTRLQLGRKFSAVSYDHTLDKRAVIADGLTAS